MLGLQHEGPVEVDFVVRIPVSCATINQADVPYCE